MSWEAAAKISAPPLSILVRGGCYLAGYSASVARAPSPARFCMRRSVTVCPHSHFGRRRRRKFGQVAKAELHLDAADSLLSVIESILAEQFVLDFLELF